jgi:GNAT superfamily N-acetyltransferase
MTAAFARGSRRQPSVSGPHPASRQDIQGLNAVFSTAFTERYRKDGLVGVNVPNLSAAIWRFAIEDSAGGAMVWRGERDEPVAFNMCHLSGTEGWMGPLAVAPAYQRRGIGKTVVMAGTEWLRAGGARVIGLETMPRTVDNIGFYSTLGYIPGRLTITVTVEAAYAERRVPQMGRLSEYERITMTEQCARLVQSIAPGYDFSREIAITHELSLGDTLVLERDGAVRGFALCHTVPLVEGRIRDELRVLKLVACDLNDVDELVTQIADYARRTGAGRAAIRLQGDYPDLYRQMIARGARVRWTDLRMTLDGYPEVRPASGIVLSNWEI